MRQKSIAVWGGALLLVAILAAYANHFHNSFHFDDGHSIINNASIRDLGNIPLFFRDATTFSALPSNQSYRPLVSMLLAIDYQLAHGLQPFWFHLSIFVLFIALTLLLALVIHHLLESDIAQSPNRWIALVAAAWYALHPANADTINYIIASSGEVISALGVIGSFAVYFAFPRARRYYLYVLPAAIATLAKPTAAIFAGLFAVFRLLFPDSAVAGRGPRARGWLAEVVPPFVICGAVLLFVQHMTPRNWTPGPVNTHNYLITQPYVALLYFKTFFWPTGLSADYDLKAFVTTGDPQFWIGCRFAVVFSAAAITAAVYKETRVIGFGLLWFLVALLPTSLFPLAEVMNCYRTFLPYIGLVIAIAGAAALLVARLYRQRSWAKIATVCTVALFLCANACATFQRNKAWKNDETLWHDVVLKSPRNERGLTAYGAQLVNKGDFAGALDYFHRAQELAPRYPELLINLAIAESATNRSAAAEQHFKEALQLAPSSPGGYDYYARYLLSHSRVDEARALLHNALELSPNDLTARELLKEAETRAGELGLFTLRNTAFLKEAEMRKGDSGLFALARAALLKRANTKAYGFGLLVLARPGISQPLNQPTLQTPEFYLALSAQFLNEERYVESIFASRRALELRPGYAEAWNNIGAAYNKLDRYGEAAAACEQALLYKPGLELARINLRYAREKLKTSRR
jgi:Flp pilus assembly protein TadD